MTWMTDAEVFYRQLDKEVTTEVNRREIVTKAFDGQTLYKLEVLSQLQLKSLKDEKCSPFFTILSLAHKRGKQWPDTAEQAGV